MPVTYVALLRGVNVGGKNVLPMAALAQIFSDAGSTDVVTFIQSGNVVFSASATVARGLADRVATAIVERFGFGSVVILRSAREFEDAIASNPFLGTVTDLRQLHVMFLARKPEPDRVATLDAGRSPGDSFVASDREIYLSLPNGTAGSKLTNAYFDAKLATTSTVRNWNTVLKLAELLRRA
ncbi:MAG: DUF1697 domain-containing protein [Candidatus Eremiobacteraeota bacterium]|nr:DUF1697 domain-containing protein [Candidatus Eremiobacteraeota bacterium]